MSGVRRSLNFDCFVNSNIEACEIVNTKATHVLQNTSTRLSAARLVTLGIVTMRTKFVQS